VSYYMHETNFAKSITTLYTHPHSHSISNHS